MLTNARTSDPSESAAAFDPDQAHMVVEAISWLYTLGPASDENMVARYKAHQSVRPEWPSVADESIRKRCSDARRLDSRIQKVGTTKSSHGKTVGKYGYVEVVAA